MKNLFEAVTVEKVKQRMGKLRPDSKRLWGRMTLAQAMAHCSLGLELADGKRRPPRMFLGRLIGGMVKRKAFGNDEPMRRNSATTIAVEDQREFEVEREQLYGLIDKFVAAGPEGCTTHPHRFFGPLTPDEWAELMYKHLDHHLRQFGA
jgi:hypothetical protein